MRNLLAFISLFLLSQCSDLISPEYNATTIRAGQSFGMCIGYCYQEIEITGEKAFFIAEKREYRGQNSPDVKRERYEVALSAADVSKIKSYFNMAKTGIAALPATVGCPDCADGGAEWLELVNSSTSSTNKVTYEFNKSPKQIAELADFLREKREEYAEKFLPKTQ